MHTNILHIIDLSINLPPFPHLPHLLWMNILTKLGVSPTSSLSLPVLTHIIPLLDYKLVLTIRLCEPKTIHAHGLLSTWL